jgi:flagellar basal body-associated protein FliL
MTKRSERRNMSILWIILIVVLVLAVLGFFGRGRL